MKKLSIKQILAEVARRRRFQAGLHRRRAALRKQLKKIDAQLAAVSEAPHRSTRGAARRRARNKMTLPEAMAKVMSSRRALSVPQIARAAKKAGYKSVSKTFHTIIYQTLARDERFKKASRGQYVLRAK